MQGNIFLEKNPFSVSLNCLMQLDIKHLIKLLSKLRYHSRSLFVKLGFIEITNRKDLNN